MTSTLITLIIAAVIVVSGLTTGLILILNVTKKLRTGKETMQIRKEILKYGSPAKAIIQDIAETSSSMHGRPGVRLDLFVTQEDGQTFQSVVTTFIPVIHIPKFQKGCEIDVKYMREGNVRKVEVEDAYVI
ncbi:hypothetical protein [Paenibacillus sp. MABNR03]|uniref:hypothetical protein n=1 Tax=Paenibacillus sp. MABNR03 TaxID=3142626 RepID=UPI003D29BD27